mgnify:CR=1 FL=1
MNEVLYIIRQRPPNWFFRRPDFNSRLLKLDALTLKNYYHSKGFLNVTVEESYSIENNSAKEKQNLDKGSQLLEQAKQSQSSDAACPRAAEPPQGGRVAGWAEAVLEKEEEATEEGEEVKERARVALEKKEVELAKAKEAAELQISELRARVATLA